MRKVGDLSQLHDKFYDRGFRVVGISSESEDKLENVVVNKLGGTFWMGSDPRRNTIDGYTQDGRIGIPHYYLVDARGVVVSSEMPSEAQIRELLGGAFDVALGKKLNAGLADAVAAYEAKAYGVAFQRANELRKSEDAAVAEDAGFLTEKIDALVKFRQSIDPDDLGRLREESRYGRLMILSYEFSGLPLGQWAEREEAKMKKTPRIKRDRKIWADLDKALDREFKVWRRPAKNRNYERRRAADGFRKLRKKHGGLVGRIAEERAQALMVK